MGRIVACLGLTHAPGQTGSPEMAPPEKRAIVDKAWAAARHILEDAAPNLVVVVSNDHFQNFFPVQPSFCVGTGDGHALPGKAYEKFLRIETHTVAGAPDFATHLLRVAEERGFPLAFSDALEFMDEVSIPEHFLQFGDKAALLPILTNCLGRNLPSPRSFFELGRIIAEATRTGPDDLRVAVLGTGGLSHDPLGPNWCLIDEDFDRAFLALVESGDTDTLLRDFTLERILAPGKGGTPETLNWFTALGAAGAGTKAEILGYTPVPEWATGMGYAAWSV